MHDEFGLRLILAEEAATQHTTLSRSPPTEEVPETSERQPRTKTLVFDQRDIIADEPFYLAPDGEGILLSGPGTVEIFSVMADSGNFNVTVETNQTRVVNDRWEDIEANAAEISNADAYERQDGTSVLTVGSFTFDEWVSFRLWPHESIEFERIRLELEREV